MQALPKVLDVMLALATTLGGTTPVGKALLDAHRNISKFAPPGAPSSDNFMKQMATRDQQMAPQRAALMSQGAPPGAAPPGGAPPPPGAA